MGAGPGVSDEGMPNWAYTGSAWAFALTIALAVVAAPALASARDSIPSASAPDLVPTGISVSPAIVEENDVVQLAVRVDNVGGMAAWAATLAFIDTRPDGSIQPVGEGSLAAPLDPGASVVLPGPAFVAVGAGEHILTVRVVGVSPPESDTSNDVLSIRMTVLPANGSPPPPPPPDGVRIEALEGLGIGGLVAVVLVAIAGLAISAPLRRPPEEALVPPPPEPPDRRPPPIWPP